MEQTLFNIQGKEVGKVNLSDKVFGVEVSTGSIYHAIRNEATNRRVGTACTKTRAEVNYSNTKPYKQKGTGNARRGDKKSPITVGGGTIFGPKPRDYSYSLPKKVKRLAMKSLLTLGVEELRLVVVQDFTAENGKTKEVVKVLEAFNATKERTVLIMKNDDPMLRRACRNIPNLHVLAYDKLSAKELLYGKKIIVLETAATNLNEFYGERD